MSNNKPYIHGAVRGIVALGVAAGLVQGVQSTGWSLDLQSTAAAGAVPERSFVSDVTLTCAGPEMSGIKGVPDRAMSVRVSAEAAPAEALGATRPTGVGSLGVGPLSAEQPAAGDKPSASELLTGSNSGSVHGTGSLAPGIAASQEWSLDNSTARGLNSAPCGEPSSDSWLIAGAGQPGRQERLILSNPGANEVTANVALFGAAGPIKSATGQGIVVPARGRTAVLLDAIAASEARPVVHVTTTGGSVRATLNDSWLDGSVPAGVDDTVAAAAPATSQVIPGIAVVDGSAGAASVRIVAPGSASAVVQLRLLTTNGGAPLPSGAVQTVKAGSVVDVPLTGVRPGTYAIQITSDVPVVAGATFSRRAGRGPGDFAWMPASSRLSGVAGLAFTSAPGRFRTLVMAATTDSVTVDVVQVDKDGKVSKTSSTIPAGAVKTVAATGVSVWVRQTTGAGELRAGLLSFSGSGATQMATAAPLTNAQVNATLSRVLPAP